MSDHPITKRKLTPEERSIWIKRIRQGLNEELKK